MNKSSGEAVHARSARFALTAVGFSLLVGSASGRAFALEPIEELGKQVFFDQKMSTPANKLACVSCHDPAVGWILPNSTVNATTVGAPGARPGAAGGIKTPANAYASFSPVFRPFASTAIPPWEGGNFWDGRAEGCGALSPNADCQRGDGRVSETVTVADLGVGNEAYAVYLGPTADQALNPFPSAVEQNIREKNVCQRIKTAPYKALYEEAFGETADCRTQPGDNPAYRVVFKRVAVSLAAWQASAEVNSFSSRRDACLSGDEDADGRFPCDNLTDEENLGHDIFYGLNDTGNNRSRPPITPGPPGRPEAPVAAGCPACHNGVPAGEPADPTGSAVRQLYADHRYHNLGLPFNREIPGAGRGTVVGLSGHIDLSAAGFGPGLFKTPTLRNVGKGASETFVKAYMHNGYLKSLEQVIHFYNTAKLKPACANSDATAEEAVAANCWPAPEFPVGVAPPFLVGDLQLEPEEEAALVAYTRTLSDTVTPSRP